MDFESIWPAIPAAWPPVGTISRDRRAVVGRSHVLFPFRGEPEVAASQTHDHEPR